MIQQHQTEETNKKAFVKFAAETMLRGTLGTAARAKGFTERSINLVVPLNSGGGTDIPVLGFTL